MSDIEPTTFNTSIGLPQGDGLFNIYGIIQYLF